MEAPLTNATPEGAGPAPDGARLAPETNRTVLSAAPAVAEGMLLVVTAQALANAAHNTTAAQQQSYITAQSSTVMGIATLYSIDTAADAAGTAFIHASGTGA